MVDLKSDPKTEMQRDQDPVGVTEASISGVSGSVSGAGASTIGGV